MDAQMIVAIVAMLGVILTGVGQIKTWHRNGSQQAARDKSLAEAQAARDAVLRNNQQAIINRLDNKEDGLQAVNIKMAGMQTHCAKVSTSLTERVANHDRELRELKNRQ